MPNTIVERKKSCVIVTIIKEQSCVHFCSEYILQGVNHNVWFPISDDRNVLFQEIEKILVINNIAINLTKLDVARKISDICTDYWIEYNKIISQSQGGTYGR